MCAIAARLLSLVVEWEHWRLDRGDWACSLIQPVRHAIVCSKESDSSNTRDGISVKRRQNTSPVDHCRDAFGVLDVKLTLDFVDDMLSSEMN